KRRPTTCETSATASRWRRPAIGPISTAPIHVPRQDKSRGRPTSHPTFAPAGSWARIDLLLLPAQHPPPTLMQFTTPRYLIPFRPKRVPHYFTDLLIIGGGLAGMRAALAADPRLSVLIVTKDGLQNSNSAFAQGGIAGVIDPEDRVEDHVADTLRAGGTLCDPAVVRRVIGEALR